MTESAGLDARDIFAYGEELIHMGQIRAMTRQRDLDLLDYFLLNDMSAGDRPWDRPSAQAGRAR